MNLLGRVLHGDVAFVWKYHPSSFPLQWAAPYFCTPVCLTCLAGTSTFCIAPSQRSLLVPDKTIVFWGTTGHKACMPTHRDTAAKASQPPPAPAAEGESRYHMECYHSSRNYALYDRQAKPGQDLVVVAVYREGAEAVKERLEAQEQTIAA